VTRKVEQRRQQLCASYAGTGELLVRATAPRLLALARARGLDHAAAEDVVQEAFAALFQKRPELGDVEAWLVCVVRRRASDWLRDARLRELSDARLQPALPAPLSPIDRLTLVMALARLTPRQRALVEARFCSGHSEHDAALLAGYAPASFKKTMSRILRRLRGQLGNSVEDALKALAYEPAEP
jgi:RNA polymerase sigma factor (sigma-70 family)